MSFISALLNVVKWILIILAAYIVFAMTVIRLIRHFYQFPIPSFLAPLVDNPVRRRIQSPQLIARWMGAEPGMSVLEIGPGLGTFTFEVAQCLGDGGHLYAIDIQEAVVSGLSEKVARQGVGNITVKQASAYELPFADRFFDRVFMITVLGEIPDKAAALTEIRRVLKDDGLLAIGEFLPDPDYPRRKTVISWCREVGFELSAQYGNVLHYLLTFKKS
jgi:ubiquinone/menaquinone biosynthesis C-methylase UbiE